MIGQFSFKWPGLSSCTVIVAGTENGPESLKLVSKIRFEQMVHEFPFGTFRPEKQDYLFRRSVVPGFFPLERPEKSCTIYFPTGISGKLL